MIAFVFNTCSFYMLMWFSEPKTQTRLISPDAGGGARRVPVRRRRAHSHTHRHTRHYRQRPTQPTVWAVRTDAASAATAPLYLGYRLRAYALEMGILRRQCPLGHHGTTHRAQGVRQSRGSHHA
eukprot:6952092-Prymnesium_polylepis.1